MSPLLKQLVPVVFTAGVDTKTDDKQLTTKLATLQNAVFTSPGKLRKRYGYTSLSAGSITTGKMLATRGSELVLLDGTTPWSWNASNSAWVNKGTFLGTSVRQTPVARPSYYVYGQDCAQHSNGVQCFVYELWQYPATGLQGVFYSMVDSSTGQVIATGTVSSAVCSPKVICVGSQFAIIVVSQANAQHLYGYTLSATSPTNAISGSTQLDNGTLNDALRPNAALTSLHGALDACLIGSTLYVAFVNNNGGATVYSYASGALFSQVASRSTGAAAGLVNIGIFSDSFNSAPVIIYSTTTPTVRFEAYAANLGSTLAGPTTIDTTISGTINAGQVCGISMSAASLQLTVYYSFFQSASTGIINSVVKSATISGSYAVSGAAVLVRGASLAGKPLLYSGGAYVPVVYSIGAPSSGCGLQPTYFIVGGTQAPYARWAAGLGSGPYYNATANYNTGGQNGTMLPETLSLGSSAYLFPSLVADLLTSASGRVFSQTGLNAVTVTMGTLQGYRAEIAGSLHIGGGVLMQYDGQNVVEHNFHLYPESVTVSTNAAGGSIAAGVYQYAACYAWMDAQGTIHRSTPSAAVSVTTTGATSTNTVTIPTLRLTGKSGSGNPVYIEVYRTLVNATTFYLVNTGAVGGTTGLLVNSVSADTVTCTDTSSDANISSNTQLYTTGGVLSDAQPNPLGPMCVHRNRIVAVDSTNQYQLVYTKQVIPPSLGVAVPAEFSASLYMNVDPRGGAVTAIGSMDDKLIIFKAGLTFAVTGQGPDATGGQNDYSDPVIISADVGCSVQASVVLTPMGLIFLSAKGYYLLGRDLTVRYIGADVEAYNASTPTSAVLVPGTQQVRFTYSASSPWALVYDYYTGQWDTFTNANTAPIADAVVWNNTYTVMTTAGVVWQESTGFAEIGGGAISRTIKTGWLSLAQLQGFQRIWRVLVLGTYKSAHTLTVNLYYNFGATPETHTFTVNSDPAPYLFRVFPATQKCTSIQIEIIDTPTSTTEGSDITGIALEVGVINRGGVKLPSGVSA